MSVDLTCERIIRQICSSNLDYHMNQTPYSIFFSIRKKFIKGHHSKPAENPVNVHMEPSEVELFNIKMEYAKLYSCYENTIANENLLKSEILRLTQIVEGKAALEDDHATSEENLRKLHAENKLHRKEISEFIVKYDQKCLEIKPLKDEITGLKKDKNDLSVALKRSKKENSETVKSHEKKIKHFEAKIVELVDFKNEKLSEERDLKIKKRKERKKAKKEISKVEYVDAVINNDPNMNNIEVTVPVYNPFDVLQNDPATSPSTSATSSSALSLPSASGSSSESSSEPYSSTLSSESQRILLAALQEYNGKLEELSKVVEESTIFDKKLDKIGDLAKNI